jgi:hypothetical protein
LAYFISTMDNVELLQSTVSTGTCSPCHPTVWHFSDGNCCSKLPQRQPVGQRSRPPASGVRSGRAQASSAAPATQARARRRTATAAGRDGRRGQGRSPDARRTRTDRRVGLPRSSSPCARRYRTNRVRVARLPGYHGRSRSGVRRTAYLEPGTLLVLQVPAGPVGADELPAAAERDRVLGRRTCRHREAEPCCEMAWALPS